MLAYWQAILDEAGTHAIGAQDVLEMYRPSNYNAHAAAAFVAADGDFTVRCAQRRIADLLVPAGVRVFEYVPPIATAPLRAPARTCMAYTHARVRTPRQSPAPHWMDDRPSRYGSPRQRQVRVLAYECSGVRPICATPTGRTGRPTLGVTRCRAALRLRGEQLDMVIQHATCKTKLRRMQDAACGSSATATCSMQCAISDIQTRMHDENMARCQDGASVSGS